MRKVILFILSFIFLNQLHAQDPASGFVFGLNFGTSKMITEVSPDFSQHYSDFDQSSGFAIDLELSKPFLNHFEAGTALGISNIKGRMNDPSESYNKYHVEGDFFIRDLEAPLTYHNQLLGHKFFLGYYFRSFDKIDDIFQPEPFIRAGAGYIVYGVELFENNESTFGKGSENYADLNMTSALMFATVGVKSYISSNIFMNLTYTMNYTNYDYLDAVFNFDNAGTRLGFGGIYSEIKIGFFYQAAGKGKRNTAAKNGLGPNLPFSR